jgi:hypothetical protein
MITTTKRLNIFTLLGLAALITLLTAFDASSQDTTKVKGGKKVKIVAKVVSDKDGHRTVFDTTISLNRDLKPGERHEIMKEIEMKLKDVDDQMKTLEVELSNLNLPDSLLNDSTFCKGAKMLMLRNCPGGGNWNGECFPGGFSYNFDMDDPGTCMGFGHGRGQCGNICPPGSCRGMMMMGDDDQGETLSDLIGDIPLDRITSYSIKDTKNGKRIVIDVQDEPLGGHGEKVIVITGPGKGGHHGKGYGRNVQKRIIIQGDDMDK